MEIKITKTGYFTKKKVLEMGLQAANKMKRFLTDLLQSNGQRHRTVRPTRLPGYNEKVSASWDANMADKLEKFVDAWPTGSKRLCRATS